MSVKHEILNVISLALRCDDTNMRRAVPVEKGLEIFLWRLATGNSCRNIWKLFRVGKSTDINFFFQQGISSIISLANNFKKFLKILKIQNQLNIFKSSPSVKFLQVVGAIDGIHIEIMELSADSKADYYCKKQWYTISTQAIIGSNLIFLDVATGFPGSVHDARILRLSS